MMFTIRNSGKDIVQVKYITPQRAYISNSGEPSELLFGKTFPVNSISGSVLSDNDSVTGITRYNKNKTPTRVVECTRTSDATYVVVEVPPYTE